MLHDAVKYFYFPELLCTLPTVFSTCTMPIKSKCTQCCSQIISATALYLACPGIKSQAGEHDCACMGGISQFLI
jgi:hypothetical protein